MVYRTVTLAPSAVKKGGMGKRRAKLLVDREEAPKGAGADAPDDDDDDESGSGGEEVELTCGHCLFSNKVFPDVERWEGLW